MKNFTRALIVFLLALASCNVFSQTEYARLDKNKNPQAEGFYHNLNKTKDTLILKSERKINYLYSIDKSQNKDLNLLVDSKTYKLPLNKLGKGKHVFVAIQSPLRIVFVVHMLQEIPIVTKKVADISEMNAIDKTLVASDNH